MPIKSVRIQFDKLMGETPKAYLFLFGVEKIWFPRRFCRGLVINKKLGGNVAVPSWLYKEKFGEDPDTDIAETIIEKHVPIRLEPVKNKLPDASLIKQSAS